MNTLFRVKRFLGGVVHKTTSVQIVVIGYMMPYCLVIALWPGAANAQQYQDGYVYQNWIMPSTAWNLDTYIWPALVSNSSFFAQTFQFENNVNGDDGAYMGIQQKGDDSRVARFSIWNATADLGINCREFGGEGIGRTCEIPFQFSTGAWYKLRIWRLEAEEAGQWWGAWIIETNGNEHYIGSIRAPHGTGDIAYTSTFNEYFGPAAECGDLPASVVYVYAPAINNSQDRAVMDGISLGGCSDGSVTALWDDRLSRLQLNMDW